MSVYRAWSIDARTLEGYGVLLLLSLAPEVLSALSMLLTED